MRLVLASAFAFAFIFAISGVLYGQASFFKNHLFIGTFSDRIGKQAPASLIFLR
jgi:hypothetical protein